jgi:Na+/pantothenate symporter
MFGVAELVTLSVFLFFFQEVLHTICSPSGQVLRIVIFTKNGVQAMVEYPLVQGLYWNLPLQSYTIAGL